MAEQLTTLKFYSDRFSFAAGHFTVFSATKRERMHGHTYRVKAKLTVPIRELGMAEDYALFDDHLAALCKRLNTFYLLPRDCPHLPITEVGEYYETEFNGKKLTFLKEDCIVLPVINITIEELSRWFVQEIMSDQELVNAYDVRELKISVYNGFAHGASAEYIR